MITSGSSKPTSSSSSSSSSSTPKPSSPPQSKSDSGSTPSKTGGATAGFGSNPGTLSTSSFTPSSKPSKTGGAAAGFGDNPGTLSTGQGGGSSQGAPRTPPAAPPDGQLKAPPMTGKGIGVLTEMAFKAIFEPSKVWPGVAKMITAGNAQELARAQQEFVQSFDYEGTVGAVEVGAGWGTNNKGFGASVSINPDDTINVGAGGSWGPATVGVNPQDRVPGVAYRLPLPNGYSVKPKVGQPGSGVWGLSFKPPLGPGFKVGANSYGNYMGGGFTHKVGPGNVSWEVAAYGGFTNRVVEPVVNTVSTGFWNVAKTTAELAVIGSYHVLGPDLTAQLFFKK